MMFIVGLVIGINIGVWVVAALAANKVRFKSIAPCPVRRLTLSARAADVGRDGGEKS